MRVQDTNLFVKVHPSGVSLVNCRNRAKCPNLPLQIFLILYEDLISGFDCPYLGMHQRLVKTTLDQQSLPPGHQRCEVW